ncbi:hypothetical protein AGLY_006517 [Aphis glycines]|uniref:acid phosphatase n=1 Tax=Aphis glycines TaxID=307491 RepID=A0A6G0TRD6_APHGL|nr:hypothetical protein AGLY_006517 [Aphis glycines]
MALDFKKVLIVGFSIIIVGSVLFIFAVRWDRQTNHIIGPGRFSDPTLKSVSVLCRHGNRGPMFKYNTDPYKNIFPEGHMGLTKKGKQNMYKKGQILRRLYNGFLSDLYLESEILIKTTNTSRTFMTAAMVLAGIYPPKDYQKWSDSETVWQPIPIHNDSPDRGILFGSNGVCPSIDSFNKNHDQIVNNIIESDENIKSLMSYLSEKCGQPITGKNVLKLYDLFVCQMAEGSPLPEWIKPHHIATIKSIISKKEFTEFFFENTSMQKLYIGPLLNEIGLNMESRSNNNDTRKMYLYSGHDISISMAISFLGNIIEIPGFGASLHFHMYHDVTNGYIVKVLYFDQWDNEKGKEVIIPNCGNPCKFEDFKTLLAVNFSEKWENECQKV